MTTTALDPYTLVGQRLNRFQRSLASRGSSLKQEIDDRYLDKWRSETLYHVSRVRTALVAGMMDHLVEEGLLNLERVSVSLVTDPLAHTVEHLPEIPYRGSDYVTTHSMIYAKFLACHNPHLKGIFVDSPNIRLEPADPHGRQRGRYLIDFSQLDVEVRRNRELQLDAYLDKPREVTAILQEDLGKALKLFEGMTRAGFAKVQRLAGDSLDALGVRIDLPEKPFPVFYQTEAEAKYGTEDLERKMGEATESQFFFVVGLMRENYDLIYPYLRRDGSRRAIREFTSREIFNYDLCVKGRQKDGTTSAAKEVLSGGLREWLPEAIVARLLDNGVIPEAPILDETGEIQNLEALGGYGPFLTVALSRDGQGRPLFPETFGGGIGIERLLWTLLRGPFIKNIDDVTFFGKNPDSTELFLF
jgi:aspartyl/asparaginyl-tRNA synthetase